MTEITDQSDQKVKRNICELYCPHQIAGFTHAKPPPRLPVASPRMTGTRVRALERLGDAEICALGDVLIDCVEGGASVSFMLPMTRDKADTFWREVAASLERGERQVYVAEDASGIVGTVQVVWAQPENQPHRADVAKMLVHRRARRRGLGAALLDAAEQGARAAGRTLLVLDTVTDAEGHRLYAAAGWQRCGEIPEYALWPGGGLCATTVFYKALRNPLA